MSAPNFFERHPGKTLAVVVCGSLLLLDVFSASLYRFARGYPFHEIWRQRAKAVEKTYRIPSDVYHHDLAPNVDIEGARWGHTRYAVATDSLGFRSKEPSETPLASASHRVVFIGDSFTEGTGVEYAETFVGRIAGAWSENDVEVLNAGVISYSPIIYYKKIEHLLGRGFELDELVVFIDISDIYDEVRYEISLGDAGQRRGRPVAAEARENVTAGRDAAAGDAGGSGNWRDATKIAIRKNTIAAYWLMKLVDDLWFDRRNFQYDQEKSRWTLDDGVFARYGALGLEESGRNMGRLHDLLAARDVAMTIAVYPWPDQILGRDLESRQVTYWRQWAEPRGVDFLNYFPCFIDPSWQEREDGYETLRRFFIRGDMHWNEAGHRLVADEVARSLGPDQG